MVKRLRKKKEPYTVQPEASPKADGEFVKAAQKCAHKLERAGKPKFTTEVRLVKGSLTKNCCKDRTGGAICGSVYEEVTRDEIGRVVRSVCYPNNHERKLKPRKEVA